MERGTTGNAWNIEGSKPEALLEYILVYIDVVVPMASIAPNM